MNQAPTEVARAVRRMAKRVSDHQAVPDDYATVNSVAGGKIKATVHGTGERLDDDEIIRGYALKLYVASVGLAKDDVLAVRRMRDGDWLAYEVVSTATVSAPVATIPTSLIDAKGDLLVGTADNAVARKAVGSDGQLLTADAASAGGVKWAAPAAIPTVTALPAGTNGQEVYFQTLAMANAGMPPWHLRYRTLNPDGSTNTSAYKWDVLAATPLRDGIAAVDKIAPITFGANDLGPAITLPLSGDYEVNVTGDRIQGSAVSVSVYCYATPGGGTKQYAHNDQCYALIGQFIAAPIVLYDRMLGAVNGGVIKPQFGHGDTTSTVQYRSVIVTAKPLRVG